MEDNQELLKLSHVRKEFELKNGQRLKAVSDVDLTIAKGECVAIVGESGCGKSTLAKLVAQIEPVTEGSIFYEGNDVTDISGEKLRQYRRQIQMVFQDPSAVFSPRMKMGTFLMEPWRNFEKVSKKEAKDQAMYALKRVRLDETYFHKYPHQLSGGELQRVAIARAIALHPQLLICDEATSALDVSVQQQIIELLREHQIETKYGILFICHDLALAESFGNRVVVMYLGHIVEILDGGALKKQARHPYTIALLNSVFSVYEKQDEKIHVLQGEPPSPVNLPEGCVFCGRCSHATELCRTVRPQLTTVDGNHMIACHMAESLSSDIALTNLSTSSGGSRLYINP